MEGATELNLFLFFVDLNIAYGSSLENVAEPESIFPSS